MTGLTLPLMRESSRRLLPSALAILVAAAFVAGTLIGVRVLTSAAADRMGVRFADADLVVSWTDEPADAAALARIRAVPQVVAADPLVEAEVRLQVDGRAVRQLMVPAPADPRLSPLTLTAGRLPATGAEIALPGAGAERLGLALGDRLAVATDGGAGGAQTVELVGLLADPAGAWTATGGAGMARPDVLADWAGQPGGVLFAEVLVVADDPAAAAAAIEEALDGQPGGALVRTAQELSAQRLDDAGDASRILMVLVLGFAGIALLVAALVITNTFAVLIAQRTRTLALLRCVGARRRQIGRSVLIEGALLGIAASTAGVLVAVALAQLVLWVMAVASPGAALPTAVPMSAAVVLVPVVVGTLVSTVASWFPARAAGRVPPTAALRPADATPGHRRASRLRGIAAALLLLAGAGQVSLAATGALIDTGMTATPLWLAMGMLGGSALAVGALLGAVHWVPWTARLAAPAVRRLGPVAELASANVGRNPRRAAATCSALLIGVTLVAMMSTGAASARRSVDASLDAEFPVDVQVAGWGQDRWNDLPALPDGVLPSIAAVPGVAQVVPVAAAPAEGAAGPVVVYGLDLPDAGRVLNDPAMLAVLAAGGALVPPELVGGPLELTGAAGTVVLPQTAAWSDRTAVLVGLPALRALDPQAPVAAAWAALAEGADAALVRQDIEWTLSEEDLYATSAAADRQEFDDTIGLLFAIVLSLLGFAVLIALIGVANTLSLSVVERRREIATLRAVGMTRRQLRSSLATEGVLLALIGSVVGIVLGVLLGWAGTTVVFGSATVPVVPWRDLALVAGVAVAAGHLASVLPARAAARTAPVAALAAT